MVEAHGGEIKVDSVLGKGSTFTMEFPLKNFNVSRHVSRSCLIFSVNLCDLNASVVNFTTRLKCTGNTRLLDTLSICIQYRHPSP
jgi:light-regulated signal transduction histidine kinase (bacteriophytochrome)